MYVALIAFYLSILTFYLGVLIYALPIPIAGLKRWGPRLINDAFFIATIISSISLILNFVDMLRQRFGGDWGFFLNVIKGFILYRSTLVVFLSALSDTLKFIPGLSKILRLGVNIVALSLYFTFLLYFLGLLIYYNVGTLISLGLAFMAIPFRVARNAGAYLLSFAIVFYLALPLYPNFLLMLSVPMPKSSLDLAIVYGNLYNFLGYRITEGYVGLDVNGDYIGPAKLTYDGRMFILMPREYLSSRATLYFDASSHRFFTNISGITLASMCRYELTTYMCRIDAVVKGVLYYSKGLTLHIHPPPSTLKNVTEGGNSIEFNMCLDSSSDLYISATSGYELLRLTISNQNSSTTIDDLSAYHAYDWVWYNVPGSTYIVSIPNGCLKVRLEYSIKNPESLEPNTEHIYPVKILQRNELPTDNMFDSLAYAAYLEIISSILYLSLLLSISYGLSRLLGGTYKLRLIP